MTEVQKTGRRLIRNYTGLSDLSFNSIDTLNDTIDEDESQIFNNYFITEEEKILLKLFETKSLIFDPRIYAKFCLTPAKAINGVISSNQIASGGLEQEVSLNKFIHRRKKRDFYSIFHKIFLKCPYDQILDELSKIDLYVWPSDDPLSQYNDDDILIREDILHSFSSLFYHNRPDIYTILPRNGTIQEILYFYEILNFRSIACLDLGYSEIVYNQHFSRIFELLLIQHLILVLDTYLYNNKLHANSTAMKNMTQVHIFDLAYVGEFFLRRLDQMSNFNLKLDKLNEVSIDLIRIEMINLMVAEIMIDLIFKIVDNLKVGEIEFFISRY